MRETRPSADITVTKEARLPGLGRRRNRGRGAAARCARTLLLAALALPGASALAQPPETLPFGSPAAARPAGPPEGAVYTWEDGDRTLKVWLQEDLVVTKAGTIEDRVVPIASTGAGLIVQASSARTGSGDDDGQPVFRSESGSLMTLPGGVVLMFEADWSSGQREAFFAAHGIESSRVSPLGELPNAFLIETEPGVPALELANALAGRDGVVISSPNWWQEVTTK